ncbi:MAG: glycosyltransferase [Planctomycetota bacterium]
MPATPNADALRKRLTRNLLALQRHRPELWLTLQPWVARQPNPYLPVNTPAGQPTLAKRVGDTLKPVCSSPLPAAHAKAQAQAAVAQAHNPNNSLHAGEPLILAGLGDGHLLTAILHATEPTPDPNNPLQPETPVLIFEPDGHRLLAGLALHDFAAPQGPIRNPRVAWHAGENALTSLRKHLLETPELCPPTAALGDDDLLAQTRSLSAEVSTVLKREVQDHTERVAALYANRPAAHFADALAGKLDRAPRVLLLTSQFTTVLQHSTRDAQDAFNQLGFDTQLLIEPAPHLRITSRVIRQALLNHQPDLVFFIDRLRRDTHNLFPPELPFVCWAQDQLAAFRSAAAGRSLTPRDFFLSMVGPMYASQWQYPRQQIIPVPKLTRTPRMAKPSVGSALPPTANQPLLPEHFVYVSNNSQAPRQLLDQLVEANPAGPKRDLLRATGQSMIDTYNAGDCLPTLYHLGQRLDQTADALGQPPLSTEARSQLAHTLFHPLNNALYRQQALAWVVDAAHQLGLRVSLYGHGWDQHPTLAPYARGPVAYGPNLEALTRRARFNLQIIPSLCIHQRLLDGLVAGGFFLVRRFAADTALPRLARFLRRHAPDARSADAARAMTSADLRPRLEQLLQDATPFTDLGHPIDVVDWVQDFHPAGLLSEDDAHDTPVPRLEEVTFSNADDLLALAKRYLDHPKLAAEIAAQQRAAIEDRLSYTAGLQRALHHITDKLRHEPTTTQHPAAA